MMRELTIGPGEVFLLILPALSISEFFICSVSGLSFCAISPISTEIIASPWSLPFDWSAIS